jgi:hypothetical protein
MAPKITSSSNRSKRSTNKPVTKGQNPQRANRQQMSQAKVTNASNGKPTGAGAARVTTGRGSQLARTAATIGAIKNLSPAAIAYETLKARPLASGTLKGKVTGATQGPAVPNRLTQSGINKMKFDDAFRQARKAGQKTFTWKGKKYTTEMA